MATIDQLSTALINADKAGDTEAARTLASEITRMRSQASAPDATPQVAQPQAPDSGSGIAGTLDAFGRGAARMAGMGFIDELGAGADYAGSHIFPWRDPKTYDQALKDTREGDAAVAAAHPVADIVGAGAGLVGGVTGLAKAGLSPVARAIEGGASLPGVARASALEAGALGAVQGAGQAEGSINERARGALEGGTGGLVLGAAAPYAMAGAGAVGRRMISPFLAGPERQAASQYLANEGVDLTAGQRTGSKGLRYVESELAGGNPIFEQQGEQFTSAALRRAGIDAPRATPEVMDDAFNRIGQQFDGLAARNQLHPDTQLAQDLGSSFRDYASLVPESQRAPIVTDVLRDLGSTLSQGPLDGAAYQAVRSRLDRAARGSASDPQLQQALHGIRNSLDDAMERSIGATNPQDAGAWRDVRGQYRNMLVLEKAASGAGEDAANGLISPSALRGATVQKQGVRNYVRGDGDFGELARSGEATMKAMPNSGTASRVNARNLGLGLAGAAGTLVGTHTGDAQSAILAMIMGGAAPKLAGAALMSSPVQAILGNQVARGAQLSPTARRLLTMMLNGGGSTEAPSIGQAVLPTR